MTQGRQRLLQCYRYHRQLECPTKVSPGKDQKSLTPVGQSNKKKSRAMLASSHEDGEEAFMCVNLERSRSSGNYKKINSNRLTINADSIYNAACRAQGNDGQIWSRQVEWTASEGTMRHWMYREDCG